MALFRKPILENQYSNDSNFDREEQYIEWNIVIILVIRHGLKVIDSLKHLQYQIWEQRTSFSLLV